MAASCLSPVGEATRTCSLQTSTTIWWPQGDLAYRRVIASRHPSTVRGLGVSVGKIGLSPRAMTDGYHRASRVGSPCGQYTDPNPLKERRLALSSFVQYFQRAKKLIGSCMLTHPVGTRGGATGGLARGDLPHLARFLVDTPTRFYEAWEPRNCDDSFRLHDPPFNHAVRHNKSNLLPRYFVCPPKTFGSTARRECTVFVYFDSILQGSIS